MTYTISEIADRMGVSVHTLHFYDKEGILPFVDRVNGRRVFKDEDFARLKVINCLKNTGMPLREIRTYIELCQQGDASLQERYDLILRQKENLEKQFRQLQNDMQELEYKVWYYETALEAGTEDIHKGHPCNPTLEPDTIPEDAREYAQHYLEANKEENV